MATVAIGFLSFVWGALMAFAKPIVVRGVFMLICAAGFMLARAASASTIERQQPPKFAVNINVAGSARISVKKTGVFVWNPEQAVQAARLDQIRAIVHDLMPQGHPVPKKACNHRKAMPCLHDILLAEAEQRHETAMQLSRMGGNRAAAWYVLLLISGQPNQSAHTRYSVEPAETTMATVRAGPRSDSAILACMLLGFALFPGLLLFMAMDRPVKMCSVVGVSRVGSFLALHCWRRGFDKGALKAVRRGLRGAGLYRLPAS